jgi:NADPH-dependent ferric siderophore reductase
MKIFLPDTPAGPIMRTYTVRRFDRNRGLVAIEFFINEGDGPATQWASRVVPGMRLALGGRSRSTFAPSEDGGRYLFAGDQSALPAIATCLESLPASARATAVVEIENAEEEQALASPAVIDGRWLHRSVGPDQLLGAVRDAAAGAHYDGIWVACEAATMRAIRRALLDASVPAERLKTRGYWKRGSVDHPDHDTGDDVA